MRRLTIILVLSLSIAGSAASSAGEPASITAKGNAWTLRNDSLQATVSFVEGKLRMESFRNRAANTDYLQGQAGVPLFTHKIDGATVAADDGGWTLDGAEIKDIELYGRSWGKRLEITISRKQPVAFSTRQILEIYNGRAGLRYTSFLKNGTDKELAIRGSDVFQVNLPDEPHQLHYVTGNLKWNVGTAGLHEGGRNAIACYATGDGWFVVPENNWATCLAPGGAKGNAAEKLLHICVWDNAGRWRVAANPKAVQLTLFPREEVEYFSVNIGVFKGDVMDGRMAVSEHLRQRFKFHDPRTSSRSMTGNGDMDGIDARIRTTARSWCPRHSLPVSTAC